MDLTFTVDVPENVACFVTAFRERPDSCSYRFYVSDVNGLLYMKCKCLVVSDLEFIYKFGFKPLVIRATFDDNYFLEVCLVPNE